MRGKEPPHFGLKTYTLNDTALAVSDDDDCVLFMSSHADRMNSLYVLDIICFKKKNGFCMLYFQTIGRHKQYVVQCVLDLPAFWLLNTF